MKKILLLTVILASVSAYADGTTGMIKISNDSEDKFEELQFVKSIPIYIRTTPKIEFELKVKDTGFSIGGDYKAKNVSPFAITLMENWDDHPLSTDGKIWTKYELPEMNGIKSYVKGELSHNLIPKSHKGFKNTIKVSGEADIKYNYNGYELGLNTKTSVPLIKTDYIEKILPDINSIRAVSLSDVESIHTVSVSKEELSVLKDLKASVAVKHSYAESKTNAKDIFKSVEVKAEGSYKEIKDLELTAKALVKYNHAAGGYYKFMGFLGDYDYGYSIAKGPSIFDKFSLSQMKK